MAHGDHAIGQVEVVVGRAGSSIGEVDAVVARAGTSIGDVEAVVARAGSSIGRVDDVVGRADGTLRSADALVGSASSLLDQARPALEHLLPVLQEMSRTLSPQEVDAAVALIDRLPLLLDSVDRDVLPLARQLGDVGPDLHALLELVEELHTLISGVPGAKRLLRRAGDGDADAS